MKLKKNLFSLILTICLILPVMFALTACDDGNAPTPTPGDTVKYDYVGEAYDFVTDSFVFDWKGTDLEDMEAMAGGWTQAQVENELKSSEFNNGVFVIHIIGNDQVNVNDTTYYYDISEDETTINLYANATDFESKTKASDVFCEFNAIRNQITCTKIVAFGRTSTISATFNLLQKTQVAIPTAEQTSFVFDGTEKVVLAEGSQYVVNNGAKTISGSYTATISLKDKARYVWEDGTSTDKTIDWSISKAQPTIVVSNETEYAKCFCVKLGMIPTPNTTGSIAGGTKTVTYQKNNGSRSEPNWQDVTAESVNENAGDYRVIISYAESVNYLAGEKIIAFTVIVPEELESTISVEANTTYYYSFETTNLGLYNVQIEGATVEVYYKRPNNTGNYNKATAGVDGYYYIHTSEGNGAYTYIIMVTAGENAIENEALVTEITTNTQTVENLATDGEINYAQEAEDSYYFVKFNVPEGNTYTITFEKCKVYDVDFGGMDFQTDEFEREGEDQGGTNYLLLVKVLANETSANLTITDTTV